MKFFADARKKLLGSAVASPQYVRRNSDLILNSFTVRAPFHWGKSAISLIIDLSVNKALAQLKWRFDEKAVTSFQSVRAVTDFKYSGARRCFVACSNAYAIAINFGSLHAVPTNEMPTGRPLTKPAGTVMCG